MDTGSTDLSSTDESREVIMVSCYGDLECARQNFEELTLQVKKSRVQVRESVLLGRNADGMSIVLDTSSGHDGRTGALAGASMGFLLGMLTMPVMPISVVIGAISGAAEAKMADHTVKAGLRRDIAEHLDVTTGVVLSVVGALDELWANRALSGAVMCFTVPFHDSTVDTLEQAVAEAMKGIEPRQ